MKFQIARLKRLAVNRQPDYLAKCFSCGTVDGDYLIFDESSECWQELLADKAKPLSHPKRSRPCNETIAPLPRSEWPMTARIIARFAAAEDKGLGDTLRRLIAGVGGEVYKALARGIGMSCGCGQRQAAFNERFPYSQRE